MKVFKRLTKDQMEKLAPYEKNLTNAYRNSFVHMSGEDFQKVAEIYTEVFGEALTKSQMGCNTCRLNALRKLGEVYVTTQEAKEKKKESTKRGRPAKLNDEDQV